jgi:hypothetical protein
MTFMYSLLITALQVLTLPHKPDRAYVYKINSG